MKIKITELQRAMATTHKTITHIETKIVSKDTQYNI